MAISEIDHHCKSELNFYFGRFSDPAIKRIILYGGTAFAIGLLAAIPKDSIDKKDIQQLLSSLPSSTDTTTHMQAIETIRNTLMYGMSGVSPIETDNALIWFQEHDPHNSHLNNSYGENMPYTYLVYRRHGNNNQPILLENRPDIEFSFKIALVTISGLSLGEHMDYGYHLKAEITDDTNIKNMTMEYFREHGQIMSLELCDKNTDVPKIQFRWEQGWTTDAQIQTILTNKNQLQQIFITVSSPSPYDIQLDWSKINLEHVATPEFNKDLTFKWVEFLDNVDNTHPDIIKTFAEEIQATISK